MKKRSWLFLGVAILVSVMMIGCDKDDDDNNENELSQTDREFVMMASMSNFAEVSAGAVAANKAEHQGIREFGQMMVTEHTDAGQDLKSLASNLGLTAKDSLDEAHVMLMDSLANYNNREFDSIYISSQVRDHQMAISVFTNEANNGQHKDLRAFAEDLIPHLQMHLHHADSLRNVLMNP